jgi:hypothetical protein
MAIRSPGSLHREGRHGSFPRRWRYPFRGERRLVRASLDLMSPGARLWLRNALRYADPGHHWIDGLA